MMASDYPFFHASQGMLAVPMEQIVQAAADGIIVVDGSGQVLFANPAAERLFGRGRLTGTNFDFPLAPAARTEVELVRRDGELRIAEMHVNQLSHGTPPLVSHLVSLRDVTERKRSEAEIRALNRSLQQRVEELESYAHSVSHDLQGPLRTIRSYAGIVLQEAGALPDDLRRYLTRIEVNAERMSNLIRDLLRLSRSSLSAMHIANVQLADLARQVAGKIQEDDATGAVFVIGDLPEVRGDSALLSQVFENLFSNAIKYRRAAHPPRITVESYVEDDAHVIVVRDNGQGFAPEYAEKIFGLFERLHGNEDIAGTGVGLSIVQRAVNRHGGRVWATARPAEGATFHFTLSADPDRDAEARRDEPAGRPIAR